MQGLIIENISNLYKIKTRKGTYEANARGKFKKEEITPVVGDKVEIQILDEENKKAVIEEFKKFGFTTLIKQVLAMDDIEGESTVEEKIELKISHLDNVLEFKKEVEKTNKLFIKTICYIFNLPIKAMVIFSYIFLYILLPLAGVGAIFLFASKIAI